MKKTKLLTVAFVSALLLIAVTEAIFVKLAQANPAPIYFVKVGDGSPPADTKPILVLISSPKNNTAYASNNVSLTFNASVSKYFKGEIYYIASWQHSKKTYINLNSPKYNLPQFSINITNISEGPRWLEVYVVQEGRQIIREEKDSHGLWTYYYLAYDITGSSMVNFTIDTTPPKLSILSLENKTYSAASIPLNFITNERISQSIYSLDGQENVTVAVNATLTGLTKGEHNVTVYAKDEAGNIGALETIWFSVAGSFPTTSVIASVSTVAVAGLALLVYFKKRRR